MSFLHFLLLLYIILINGFSANSSGVHFRMIHKHAPEILGERTLTHSQRIKELLHGDKVRIEIISHKRRLRRELGATSSSKMRASQLHGRHKSSFSFPLLSGAFMDALSYYVSFKVGTPPQEFLMLIDTGSDLTWINCRMKSNKKKRSKCKPKELKRKKRVFHPERSKTFRTIPCNTTLCRKGLSDLMSEKCRKPSSPCSYEYSYFSTEVARGIFGYETVTVKLTNGRNKKIPNMLIGCTQRWDDSNVKSKANGILGLGFNTYGFVNHVYKHFHGKFSYCLMDQHSTEDVTNYLTFGERSPQLMHPKMKLTTLGLISDHFGVTVKGIYVNGVKLKIPDEVWNIEKGGGMIVDSGFSLTMWVKKAYNPILTALKKPLKGKLKPAKSENFDACFKVPKNSSKSMTESLVPKLEIEFMSGVRLKPALNSYFIDEDKGITDVKCFGFSQVPEEEDSDEPISILGSIMQQNHLWEFDIPRNQLGFAASSCKLPV